MLRGLLAVFFTIQLSACGGSTSDASDASDASKTSSSPPRLRQVAPGELRTPSDFAGIADKTERSRALFLEASRVLFHPRCMNCHPNGDSPLQGMHLALHDPPVVRGPDNHGVVAMQCTGCHQDRNQAHTRVPGAPKWALAPIEMAWVGKTAKAVCEQIKDPKRNGGKTIAEIVHHNGHDELVAWGWSPGAGREPAPGSQQQFGALFEAWAETGAACPLEGAKL